MSEPAIQATRRHRLEVRVSPEQDVLIRQAADLQDTTVT
ncbi:MAG: type II toxin -antitoxin system TacA 1-like antitoxin, partial [Acidimicrobiales bacterium]